MVQTSISPMIPRPKLTRIPGELPVAKAERYVEDFSKLSKVQLLELRDRQLKLLENKQRIAQLPDNGKRIHDFYDKILIELAHRDGAQEAADLFSDLNIVATGQEKLTSLEWTGQLDNPDRDDAVLDSDDEDEVDPLKIIAQRHTTDKVVKFIKPDKSLITEADLKEIESFEQEKRTTSVDSLASSSGSVELEPHAVYLMTKAVDHLPTSEKFKPYKTTRSNVHDPQKEMQRKLGQYWENTAATPPLLLHPGVKMLSLQESIEVQADYEKKLKEIQEKQARDRLAAKSVLPMQQNIVLPDEAVRKLSKFFGAYRTDVEHDSDSELERHEEYFSEADDTPGVVHVSTDLT